MNSIVVTSTKQNIKFGYEGEDNVTKIIFPYDESWLEYGEGNFEVRILRCGDEVAYTATDVVDDRQAMTLTMTVTDIELSVRGRGEMQLCYVCPDSIKKSPIYQYTVNRSVDYKYAVDPPEGSIIASVEKSLSEIKNTTNRLSNSVISIESSIDDVNSQIDNINDKISEFDEEIDSIGEVETRVDNLETSTQSINGRINTAEGNINENTESISDLNESVTELENRKVTDLETSGGKSDSGKYLTVGTDGKIKATSLTIPPTITVDASLSTTSTNPVQNKVIKTELNNINSNIATCNTEISKLNGSLEDVKADLGNETEYVLKNINGLRIRTNNLFDKYNPDIRNIIANGEKVNPNDNARSVVIPVNITTQTNITVTRTVMSARFTVAKLTAYPNVGTASSGVVSDNSAKSLTISVDSTIKYISVYFWLSTADTLTVYEILEGLMVEFGKTFTGYSDPYKLINQNQLNDLQNAIADYATSEISLTYVSATSYYAKNKELSTYEGVTTATVNVSEGEEYLLTTRNYYNAAIACLFDSNNTIQSAVWVASNTAEVKRLKIVIPTGITKMMIQRLYAYEPTKLWLVTGIKRKYAKSVLEGKRITLIGDSITEKNSRAKTNWALWIKDWTDATIQNLGASGTGFIAGGSNSYSNRLSRIDSPDIIGVACSFNDMSNSVADLTTAASNFFDDLLTEYPSTPIICYVQSPWSAYHYGITASDNWVNALREICNTRGISFYDDLYKGCVLKPWIAENRAVFYMNDGEGSTGDEDWVHPNSEGHKVIARYLYPRFVENLVATGLNYI